jgi:spermidine synthase
VDNSTRVKPDPEVIETFRRELFPAYQNDPRVDILYNNEDFGVGAKENIEKT